MIHRWKDWLKKDIGVLIEQFQDDWVTKAQSNRGAYSLEPMSRIITGTLSQ